MQLGRIIEICNKAIPQSETWHAMHGESYGAYLNSAPEIREIHKVLYCVTHSAGVEHYAIDNGYDLTISHHPSRNEQLPHLVYHTALDCCRGGMNDMWAEAIGMPKHRPFDGNLGACGELAESARFSEMVARCCSFGGRLAGCLYVRKNEDGRQDTPIKRVVICTGLGGMVLQDAEGDNVPDCYITGQLTQDPKRSKFPYIIELGHTVSERCGVRMFEKLLRPHGVIIDSVPAKMDVFGSETYAGKMGINKSLGLAPLKTTW